MLKKIFSNKNTKNMSLPKNFIGGFTLVETLLAISIVSLSITGLISISSRGINDLNFVKNKLTASHLAAEGIELVRNIRDQRAVAGDAEYWSNFLNIDVAECYASDGSRQCAVGFNNNQMVVTLCGNNGCPNLTYNTDTGMYGYDTTSTNSIFNRSISIFGTQPDEVTVKSTVTWNQGTNVHSSSYTYNLFNWIYQ